jgi:hypothetical protein
VTATTATGRLAAAAEEYLARRAGTAQPSGAWSARGAWYPAEVETRPCCRVHLPRVGDVVSADNEMRAAWHHCRGITHVAALYAVPVTALRRAVRAIR